MTALSWSIVVALGSAALNGVIGALACVRSREQAVYRSLALMSLSFSLWSLGYVWAWPDFADPFWMKMMFSPLAWLPGASLAFVWSFTGMPAAQRWMRTAPLYAAGLAALALMWAGRISLQQYRAAFILGGLPVFAVALALLTMHWRRADDAAERNRRGYLVAAAWIAVVGGFTDFLPAVGIPFLSLANVSLMAYSLIVLTAIERHHLLDLRAAAGQALALIAIAGLLALLLSSLAWLTRELEGRLFLNFFILSLFLVALLPPLWERLNRVFNRISFAHQARHERAIEQLERSLEGAADLVPIEEAARAAVRSVWGAQSELLWNASTLRGIQPDRRIPAALLEPLATDPQVHTVPGLERGLSGSLQHLGPASKGERGGRSRRLLDALAGAHMRAVAPVLREGELVGALLLGAPSRGFYDLSALRWLRRLGQALGRAVRGAEIAQSLLHADRLRQMGTLAAGIAHEIRNPLSAMRGAVELLDQPGPEERRQEYQDILKEEVQRLDSILAELLDYASPSSAKARCEWTAVWERVVKLIEKDMPGNVSLETRGEKTELAVSGSHLTQILINLVKNAVRSVASQASPEVRVSLSTRGSQAVLEVVDNGSGIPADVLPRLFVPFATSSPGGTGLGLASVRRIAELYGGRATAENLPQGARFLVELPLA
ncbi:MAG: ATP-binding protein [Elusimicrobiota bacterium]